MQLLKFKPPSIVYMTLQCKVDNFSQYLCLKLGIGRERIGSVLRKNEGTRSYRKYLVVEAHPHAPDSVIDFTRSVNSKQVV
jgi:hypothetical protein